MRKGMIITATKIVEQPATEVTQKKTVTGEAPPIAAEVVPVLVAEGSEEAVPAPAASTGIGSNCSAGRNKWLVDDGADRVSVSSGLDCRDRPGMCSGSAALRA